MLAFYLPFMDKGPFVTSWSLDNTLYKLQKAIAPMLLWHLKSFPINKAQSLLFIFCMAMPLAE